MQSSRALVQGGFSAFYKTQLTYFKDYCSGFDYASFRNETGRAVRPLEDVKALLAYNVSYSAAHFARFQYLLSYVQSQSVQVISEPIRLCVFDYGCGQGLATLAMLSHFHKRKVELIIHLIEPSELALASAEKYVQALAENMHGQVTIKTHQLALDKLPDHIFVLPQGFSAVHLFSNVLDMAHQRLFDLSRLTNQLNRAVGKHICFAVSPTFYSGKLGFDQLKSFFAPSRIIVDADDVSVATEEYSIKNGMMRREIKRGRFLAFIRCVSANPHQQAI